MKLPFLDPDTSRWPTAKEPDEKVVNPSYDKQLQDSLINEFFEALEHKDPSAIKEAIMSLIHSIKYEEQEQEE